MTDAEINAVKQYVIERLQSQDHFIINIGNLRSATQNNSLQARDVIRHWIDGVDGFKASKLPSWGKDDSNSLLELRFDRLLGVAPPKEP